MAYANPEKKKAYSLEYESRLEVKEAKRLRERARYLTPEGKLAMQNRSKKSYLKNKEKVLERTKIRQHTESGREVMRASRKRIMATKEGKIRAARYTKKYCLNPLAREKIRKRQAAWYQQDRVKSAMRERQREPRNLVLTVARNQKRRALKKGATIGNVEAIAKWHKSWKLSKRVKCYWCNQSFKPSDCHQDHVIALSIGGSHSIENLCISCRPCNLSKTNRSLSAWNAILAQPVLF